MQKRESERKVGAPMHCAYCGKTATRALYLKKFGKRLSASFCSYDCYVKFWEKTPGFFPLPEYTKD